MDSARLWTYPEEICEIVLPFIGVPSVLTATGTFTLFALPELPSPSFPS